MDTEPQQVPSVVCLALQLPRGRDQVLGLISMRQLLEPGGDPDSAGRLAQELLEAEGEGG